MKPKKVALFFPGQNPAASQYGVQFHFTRKMHEAFQSRGVESRLLDISQISFLSELVNFVPDFTFAFNGLYPDDQGNFFCDQIGIPHIAFLLDAPHKFLAMSKSRQAILTFVDCSGINLFKEYGFTNSLFLPHAVEASLVPDPVIERTYEVAMLATCIDFENVREMWKDKYPLLLRRAMEEAAEKSLIEYTQSFYQIFFNILNQPNYQEAKELLKAISIQKVLDDLELFMRGKERFELVKNIKDVSVDIFGAGRGNSSWEKMLGNQANIHVHEAVSFEQALEVMKRTKILLNSCPSFREGAHERVFSGLACGALVITNDNPYLREQFQDGLSIAFYQYPRWEQLNQTIQSYLKDREKREDVVRMGGAIVRQRHTWEKRVEQIMEAFPRLLEKIEAIKRGH